MSQRDLEIYVRAFAKPQAEENYVAKDRTKQAHIHVRPENYHKRVLVFDTETTAGLSKNLLFGQAYLYTSTNDAPVYKTDAVSSPKKYLFVADDFANVYEHESGPALEALEKYATQNKYDGPPRSNLHWWSRTEFMKMIFIPEMASNTAIVGFNLPFDIARIATGVRIDAEDYFIYSL